ncbi:hypothetical protein GCM10010390_00320 [Streptomyces mordarskii]|uniref:Uncharacterized protein n=1 Tax=Streptomyces mordarskii TaxID=1226758 RepID=A0ABN1BNY2_9ACTN
MEERSAVEYGRLREIAERLAEPGGTAHALKPEVGMRGPEHAGARERRVAWRPGSSVSVDARRA